MFTRLFGVFVLNLRLKKKTLKCLTIFLTIALEPITFTLLPVALVKACCKIYKMDQILSIYTAEFSTAICSTIFHFFSTAFPILSNVFWRYVTQREVSKNSSKPSRLLRMLLCVGVPQGSAKEPHLFDLRWWNWCSSRLYCSLKMFYHFLQKLLDLETCFNGF